MASEGSGAVPELPLAAPCSSTTAGAAWALGGLMLLTATPGHLPGSQPPWPENPVLPEKEKSALSKPRPAPLCPHEPVHGDRTPISDNLAVPLFGLSWFSLQDISRSVLSTLNPPAGPRPSLAPPQPKPLAAAQSCGVLGSGSPRHPALPKWQPPHPEPPPQREEGKKEPLHRKFLICSWLGSRHYPCSPAPHDPQLCSLNCALAVK